MGSDVAVSRPAGAGPVKITVNTQLVWRRFRSRIRAQAGRGLTAKDFVVTEDGVVQTVSSANTRRCRRWPGSRPAPVADQVAPVTRGQIAPERPGDVRYKDGACWRCTST